MPSSDPPKVSIYFDFHGVFDPIEITRRLGIEPTRQFRSGDPVPSGIGDHRRDGWIVAAGPVETFEIDDLLMQIRAAVSAPPDEIKQVSSELNIEAVVTCEVQSTVSMPSLCFSEEFVQWAALIGAAIDVDIMLLEEEGKD